MLRLFSGGPSSTVSIERAASAQLYVGLQNPKTSSTWLSQVKSLAIKGDWATDDDARFKKMQAISNQLIDMLNKHEMTDEMLDNLQPIIDAIDRNIRTAEAKYTHISSYSNVLGKPKTSNIAVAPLTKINDVPVAGPSERENKRQQVISRMAETDSNTLLVFNEARQKFEAAKILNDKETRNNNRAGTSMSTPSSTM